MQSNSEKSTSIIPESRNDSPKQIQSESQKVKLPKRNNQKHGYIVLTSKIANRGKNCRYIIKKFSIMHKK
jgi:hypothetical protein